MKANVKKIIVVSSVALLLSGNVAPVFALNNQSHEPNVGYMKLDATDEMAGEVTFSNADVLKAAEDLYNQGLFTKEQYNIVFSAFTQRFGVKGENKVVHLGDGLMDVYINNVTWSAMIGLGGGAVGSAYLGAERGVILRMKQVYEPPTEYSGSKSYPRIIDVREQ